MVTGIASAMCCMRRMISSLNLDWSNTSAALTPLRPVCGMIHLLASFRANPAGNVNEEGTSIAEAPRSRTAMRVVFSDKQVTSSKYITS